MFLDMVQVKFSATMTRVHIYYNIQKKKKTNKQTSQLGVSSQLRVVLGTVVLNNDLIAQRPSKLLSFIILFFYLKNKL